MPRLKDPDAYAEAFLRKNLRKPEQQCIDPPAQDTKGDLRKDQPEVGGKMNALNLESADDDVFVVGGRRMLPSPVAARRLGIALQTLYNRGRNAPQKYKRRGKYYYAEDEIEEYLAKEFRPVRDTRDL